jgi:hypothetical protein
MPPPPPWRGFLVLKDMANQLLEARGAGRVGKRWAMNFVKRQPQVKTRYYTRRFHYQRAQCEDPRLIGDWFKLCVGDTGKVRHLDDDVFIFDDAGFMMGMISDCMVITNGTTTLQGTYGTARKQ